MLRVAMIGAGNHSRQNHLPALARYVSEHPDELELAALCDLRRDLAEEMSRRYGFSRSYTDPEEMLAAEKLDGCVAVTPVPVTARVAERVILAGVPLLMEKPPGATLEEAEEIRALAERKSARVMVSMNRRFDPALSAACRWRSDRPLEYLRAAMLRHDRREPHFFVGTAIHSLDAMRSIAGDVRDYSVTAREVDGVWWYGVRLDFDSGAAGILEVLPNCGSRAEFYELFGAGWRARAAVGEVDSGEVTCWEGGRIALADEPARGTPSFVKNGTYAETAEFISSLREERLPNPSPADVRQSLELCHRIEGDVRG